MTKPLVVVTRKWPSEVEQALAERYRVELNATDTVMSGTELKAAFRRADAVCPTVTDSITRDLIDGSSVRLIANYGVGFSHIDLAAAYEQNISVSNTPDVLTECTADLTLCLMLMAARRAGEGEREVRSGRWAGWRPTHMLGRKMNGKRLGIVGFGRIGRAVAYRAHHGFGMRIEVFNRSPIDTEALSTVGAVQAPDLAALLGRCDFVSLHCPGGKENRHLLNAQTLGYMPEHAILINTARGEVVEQDALSDALAAGRIAAAGLDVYDGEPAVPASLLACDNVVLLPHLGSATIETRRAMGFRVVENLDAFFAGGQPPDRVV